MQSSGSFFTTVQDDVQGSLLSTFALPLSMEDDPGVGSAVTSAADSASLNGMESFMGGGQYGTSYPGAYNYHDPLQAAMISAQFHDFEKEKRNDQMKLTFIMDSGASGSRGPAELRTTGASSPITPSAAIVKSENITASLFPVQPLLPLLPSHPAPISPITSEPATLVTSQSNKRMQSCSACGQVFSIKSKALYHLYMQHPQSAPAKVFPCTSCENAFARKSDMTKHFDCVHLRLRPSKCTLCPSAFFFRKDLAKHIKTVHEKRRDHACHIASCQRRFGKREHLKRHMIALHNTDRMLVPQPPKTP